MVVDVSDPFAPREIGVCETNRPVIGIALAGDCAYLAAYSAGLVIVDVTSPTAPQGHGIADTPGLAFGVAVGGGFAYAADWRSGVRVIDVTDPHAPRENSDLGTPGPCRGVTLVGDRLHVAHSSGVLVVDVSDPRTPRRDASAGGGDFSHRVAVDGPHVCLADGAAGLAIYRYDPASADGDNPSVLEVCGCWPNPAMSNVDFFLRVGAHGPLSLHVYDQAGRLVHRFTASQPSGSNHALRWDVQHLPQRTHVYRIGLGDSRAFGRLVVRR